MATYKEFLASGGEKKWQDYWEDKKLHVADEDNSPKPKFYALIEFPYPSSEGLHVGHPRSNTAMDIIARKRRMEGFNVLYPIGWDAFGLPTENYAIKTGVHPRIVTEKNISNFKRQLKAIGFSFDWSREINTTDPKYYKWTQWIFLQLFKHGLAYKTEMAINFCTSCKVGLANEEVVNGKCERCGSEVIKKTKKQWMLKITKYADRLEKDLDEVNYLEKIKTQQKNWIGRSEGAEVYFKVKNSELKIEVYTTRPDTLFGATYMVLAPEHKLIEDLKDKIENWKEVNTYIVQAKNKSDMERTELAKEKTGVELKGIKSINPVNGKEIPIWISDYVLASYGTGAIMAVPAHDERDWEFAKKFGLEIIDVIMPVEGEKHENEETRKSISAVVQRKRDGKFLFVNWKKFGWTAPVIGGIDDGETPEQAAEREVLEETGYRVKVKEKIGGEIEMHFFADNKNVWRERFDQPVLLELIDENPEQINQEESDKLETVWLSEKEAIEKNTYDYNIIGLKRYLKGNYAFTDIESGKMINSDFSISDDQYNKTLGLLNELNKIKVEADKKKVKFWLLGSLGCAFYIGLIYREFHDLDLIIKTEEDKEKLIGILHLLGYKKIGERILDTDLVIETFENSKGIKIDLGINKYRFGLTDLDFSEKELALNGVNILVISKKYILNFKKNRDGVNDAMDIKYLNNEIDLKFLNGLKPSEAIGKMTAWLEENGHGKKAVNYKLRDWVFSRQRYWGEPIPIIECEKCGFVPLEEKDLPLELPEIKEFQASEDGQSPLAKLDSWVNVKCPKCGGSAKRETDTMPQWAGSSWYFLRYIDPNNNKKLADRKKLDYWTPVDWYNGGMEHTTLHLLYSRFWHKFLFDIGIAPTSEPYAKRTSQGMILGESGEKMSKSKGNVVNPDEVVKEYGADTLRIYEMFMGPFDQTIPWDTKGVVGVKRFLEKVWNIFEFANNKDDDASLIILLNKTIKKVGEDIEAMRFNTAISAMMILINKMASLAVIPAEAGISSHKHEIPDRVWDDKKKNSFENLLKILSPFAPHMAEELWNKLGNKKSIFKEAWPVYDESKIQDERVEVVVQINGKVRAKLSLPTGISEAEAVQLAKENTNIAKYLENIEIKKTIFVPNRLISFVI